ncbi:MAG TPA: translation initiation factor IF-2 N-terminal domain-containing protein, partial [Pyrinomonadaceae bacterium]|nr:translation initiation factor IF-2 N-terminal domain-containing protein [Pyrinomonadaceae bacterium]
MTVSSKVRIYDLAKELKLDTKRLIEEVRREGVDVSVPSNSVSKELAEKIRNKYFPKKEATVKRAVKVVKRAVLPTPEAPAFEDEPEVHEPEPEVHEPEPVEPPTPAPPVEQPPAVVSAPPKQQPLTKLVKKLTPAVRA